MPSTTSQRKRSSIRLYQSSSAYSSSMPTISSTAPSPQPTSSSLTKRTSNSRTGSPSRKKTYTIRTRAKLNWRNKMTGLLSAKFYCRSPSSKRILSFTLKSNSTISSNASCSDTLKDSSSPSASSSRKTRTRSPIS